METQFLLSLTTAIFVAISASLLGTFVILKRMALVGDALSHVALPGMALGILFHFNPFLGAFGALFIAILGIWTLKYKTNLPVDTLVGIFFTSSLALGILLIPEQELLEALFGNLTNLTLKDSILSIIISAGLIMAILAIHKKLTLNMLSEELSHSAGINNKVLEFVYLLIFAVSVALGIRFVGALLMGSLVIIPAASAKNVTHKLSHFMITSVAFGIAATLIGMLLAHKLSITPGPLFILTSAVIFILTLIWRSVRK